MEKEQEILQKHLARFIIEDIFNTITKEDILQMKAPGVWTWKGNPLPAETIVALKEQATSFSNGMLWKILKSELLYLAQQRGLVKSKTEADLIASKLIIQLTQEIDKKLAEMGS